MAICHLLDIKTVPWWWLYEKRRHICDFQKKECKDQRFSVYPGSQRSISIVVMDKLSIINSIHCRLCEDQVPVNLRVPRTYDHTHLNGYISSSWLEILKIAFHDIVDNSGEMLITYFSLQIWRRFRHIWCHPSCWMHAGDLKRAEPFPNQGSFFVCVQQMRDVVAL